MCDQLEHWQLSRNNSNSSVSLALCVDDTGFYFIILTGDFYFTALNGDFYFIALFGVFYFIALIGDFYFTALFGVFYFIALTGLWLCLKLLLHTNLFYLFNLSLFN